MLAVVAVLASTLVTLSGPFTVVPASALDNTHPWLDGWSDWGGVNQSVQPYTLVTPSSTLGLQQLNDLSGESDCTQQTVCHQVDPPTAASNYERDNGSVTIRVVGDSTATLLGDVLTGASGNGATGNGWQSLSFPGDPTYSWKIQAFNGQRALNKSICPGGPGDPAAPACVDNRVKQMLTAVGSPTAPTTAPGALAILFGTNDTDESTFDWSSTNYRLIHAIDSMLEQTKNEPCRIWVNVSEHYQHALASSDSTAQARQDNEMFFNSVLEQRAETDPKLVVARWNDLVAAHPEYVEFGGIHPSRAGVAARANLIRMAAQKCPAAAGMNTGIPSAPGDVQLRPTGAEANPAFLVSWKAGAGAAPQSYRVSLPTGTACPVGWTQGRLACFHDSSGLQLTIPAGVFSSTSVVTGVSVEAVGATGMSTASASGDLRPFVDTPGQNVHGDGGASAQLRDGRVAWVLNDPKIGAAIVADNTMVMTAPGSTAFYQHTLPRPPGLPPSTPWLLHYPQPLVTKAMAAPGCVSPFTVSSVWVTDLVAVPNGNVDRIVMFVRTICTIPGDTQVPRRETSSIGIATYDHRLFEEGPVESSNPAATGAWPITFTPNVFPATDLTHSQRFASLTATGAPDGRLYLNACRSEQDLYGGPLPSAQECYSTRTKDPATSGAYTTAAGYEFWNGSTWVSDRTQLAPVVLVANTAGSPLDVAAADIAYVPGLESFVMATRTRVGGVRAYRIMRSASPQGPWVNERVVPTSQAAGDCQAKGLGCYAPRVHPELSSSRFLAVSMLDFDRAQVHVHQVDLGAGSAYQPMSDRYTAVAPTRIVNTSTGLGGVAGPLPPGASLTVAATGVAGVPSTARAVALSVAVDHPADSGALVVYPADEALPGAYSTMMGQGGDLATVFGNGGASTGSVVNVPMRPGGAVTITNPANTFFNSFCCAIQHTNVTVDVVGWWGPSASGVVIPSGPTPLGPPPLFEVTTGPSGIVLAAVPNPGAAAILANVTVVNPSAEGTITATAQYATSAVPTFGFPAGETRSYEMILPVAWQYILVKSSVPGTRVRVDQVGWVMTTSAPQTVVGTHLLTARRGFHSQYNGGSNITTTPRVVCAAGRAGIPTNATGVYARVTPSSATAFSEVKAWPTGPSAPAVYVANATSSARANPAYIALGPDGCFNVATVTGSVVLNIEFEGYQLA